MVFLDITSAINDSLRSFMLGICEVIYWLIKYFFDLFEIVGTASILKGDVIDEFYNRVGLLLGLFMLFRVIFSLIQYVINPDLFIDKQKGVFNIVKRIIIVIVLLGITRPLFNFAFDVQNLIIEENVIGKVITGKSTSTINSSFGGELGWYAFSTFYTLNDGYSISSCPELKYMDNVYIDSGSLRHAYNCVNIDDYINDGENDRRVYKIDFTGNGIVAVIVGALILWMVIMYTIQAGIRVIQLAYLQLIAPIPIMLYIAPGNDDKLNKWFKQCITTYLDFFLRVAIIYFVVFIIDQLIENTTLLFDKSPSDGFVLTYVNIVFILALLVFAKKAPDLIKEIFPMPGGAAKFDFGLSPKKVFNDTLAARAIGATVGFVGAGASNAIHGYMNMRKAWKQNKIDKKWSDMSDDDRKKFARTWGSKNIKGWADMKDAEKEAAVNNNLSEAEAAYNKNRLAQMGTRTKAVSGAAVKGAFSVAGGQIGGAVAGLKTKDISKSGDAIKTANANREKRALREEAGYHWYNPIPLVGDKILEFSGDLTEEDIKKRNQAIIDEKEREHRMSEGESLYNSYTYVNEEGDLKFNYRVAFASQEYIDSYENIESIKKQLSAAEKNMDSERANFQAAYNSGDEKEIAKAEARLNAARGNLKSMQGKLDDAKVKHEKVKSDHPEDARREDSYKYYKDNRTSEIVDIDKAGREAAANYDAKREVKETKITSKEEQINDTEKELNELEQEVIVAIAHGDSEDVQKKRKEYEALEKQRDLLYEELSELEDSSVEKFKPSVDASTQPQSSVSGVKYTMDDLRKAEREYRRYEQLERFGRATDVEVQQKKNEYERIRQWLENNNN